MSFGAPLVNAPELTAGKLPSSIEAKSLIDAYIDEYRIARIDNANGRQMFELPAFFATVAGVASTAFGGNPDAVIAAGTANAVFRSGNAYYSPKTKADLYNLAIKSLLCVHEKLDTSDSREIDSLDLEIDRLLTQLAISPPPAPRESGVYSSTKRAAYKIEAGLNSRLSDVTDFESISKIVDGLQKAETDEQQGEADANAADPSLTAARNTTNAARAGGRSASPAQLRSLLKAALTKKQALLTKVDAQIRKCELEGGNL